VTDRKRLSFEGYAGGVNYDWVCYLAGFGSYFYQRAAMALPVRPGMRVLDVGCGTAGLGLAVSERVGVTGRVYGIDLSQTQVHYARRKTLAAGANVHLIRGSMDTMPFESNRFDSAVSSLAFHEVPAAVRRGTLREIARVLKPGGFFALVDWARPRWSLGGLAWLPFLLAVEYTHDNWYNTYPALCQENGLVLSTDVFLRSAIRCQVFRKGDV
jgi:ubiquinone/menaquinone biosynthesis C-methylase UbiE